MPQRRSLPQRSLSQEQGPLWWAGLRGRSFIYCTALAAVLPGGMALVARVAPFVMCAAVVPGIVCTPDTGETPPAGR